MTEQEIQRQERFFRKIIITPCDCWEWQGERKDKGYGKLKLSKVHWKAHRLAYHWFKGPIPEGQCVCHTCDNPPCCNPDHLFVGTFKDNWDDCDKKGRSKSRGSQNLQAKITEGQAREIFVSEGSYTSISKKYGIGRQQVADIKKRLVWVQATLDLTAPPLSDHLGTRKLTNTQVIEIYTSPFGYKKLAKLYNSNTQTTRSIKKGLTYKDVTEPYRVSKISTPA